jgi:hypothetical protein
MVTLSRGESMAEQTENTTATQPLNKELWMQALDELEQEYIAFLENNDLFEIRGVMHRVRPK